MIRANETVAQNGDRQLEILQKRMQVNVINMGMIQARSVIERIDRDTKALEDFIVPLGRDKDGLTNVSFNADKGVFMTLQDGHTFSMHPHAMYQAAEKLGAPASYLKDLAVGARGKDPLWQQTLAATILNEHSSHTGRQRVLVRAVRNEVRGVLSDQYRRLNSSVVIDAFMDEVHKCGGVVTGADATDTRLWIDTYFKSVVPVPTKMNGTLYMALGARLSSSDFGDGALDLRTHWLQVVCLNGSVGESVMHQVHLGARIPDDLDVSERTYQLDTRTQASLIRDFVLKSYSADSIRRQCMAIQNAGEEEVDMDSEIKKLTKVSISIKEADLVKSMLMTNDPANGITGGASLLKLSQAVSAVGRDQEDVVRRRELQELSGFLLKRVQPTM